MCRSIFNPYLNSNEQKLFHTNPLQALESVYDDIVKKDLVINIYERSSWGTYRHLPVNGGEVNYRVQFF